MVHVPAVGAAEVGVERELLPVGHGVFRDWEMLVEAGLRRKTSYLSSDVPVRTRPRGVRERAIF